VNYTAATRYGQLPAAAIATAAGQATPSPIAVSLAAPATSGSIAVDWRGLAFAALLPEMAPGGAQYAVATVSVVAAPLGAGGPSQTLFSAAVPNADASLGSFEFGRALPAGWKEFRSVSYRATKQVPATSVSAAVNVDLYASRFEPLAAGGPVTPRLSPARAPQIAGRDALQAQTGVGATPLLAWSAPGAGSPTHYSVYVVALPATAPQTPLSVTGVNHVAFLSTTDTSIRIPPGVLQSGKAYVAAIVAARNAAWSLTTPYRIGTDTDSVQMITAPFTP
jgi:hypothetical protein